MKKIHLLLYIIVTAIVTTACKKDTNNNLLVPEDKIDYASYRVVKAVFHTNGTTDTVHYVYNGNNQSYIFKTRDAARTVTTHFLKHSNYYSSETYTNNIVSATGYHRLNNMGYIDSAANLRSNNTFNNIDRYMYNEQGYNVTAIVNYISYQQHATKYYKDNNYSYWINNYTNVANPASNKRDSIVFEFYADKPQHNFYKTHLPQLYGKATKNLVKKRTYYNAAKAAYQTWEYEYNTNEIGLVTKEVFSIYTQPGAVLNRSDTTYYTYNK